MVTTLDKGKNAASNPLIPEKYLDVPSQRLYYLSLGLLCQVSKLLTCSSNVTQDTLGHQSHRLSMVTCFNRKQFSSLSKVVAI